MMIFTLQRCKHWKFYSDHINLEIGEYLNFIENLVIKLYLELCFKLYKKGLLHEPSYEEMSLLHSHFVNHLEFLKFTIIQCINNLYLIFYSIPSLKLLIQLQNWIQILASLIYLIRTKNHLFCFYLFC